MDRFAMQFSLGYISANEEVEILSNQIHQNPIDQLQPCLTLEEMFALKQQVKAVTVSPALQSYIVSLVTATRQAEGIQLGASPRGSIALMKTSQALALFDGYTAIRAKHVQEIAVAVLSHRLVMEPQARFSGQTPDNIVKEIVKRTAVPS